LLFLASGRVDLPEYRVDAGEVGIELERPLEGSLGKVHLLTHQVHLAKQFVEPCRRRREPDLSLDAVEGHFRPLLEEGDTDARRRRVDVPGLQRKGRFELLLRRVSFPFAAKSPAEEIWSTRILRKLRDQLTVDLRRLRGLALGAVGRSEQNVGAGLVRML